MAVRLQSKVLARGLRLRPRL